MAARVLIVLAGMTVAAAAQVTTGTVSGSVRDVQGGAIPGATVVLISETQGTKSIQVVTNAVGDFVFANVVPDTYAVDVTTGQARRLARYPGMSRHTSLTLPGMAGL